MRKSAELEGPSCITKAWDNEIIFVLLAPDEAAPVAIEAWIAERIRTGKNQPKDAQIIEAQQCANVMREQREPLREAIHTVDQFNHRDSRINPQN